MTCAFGDLRNAFAVDKLPIHQAITTDNVDSDFGKAMVIDKVEKEDGKEYVSGHIGKKYAPKKQTISILEYNDLVKVLTKYHSGKYHFKTEDILQKIMQLVER